MTSTPFTTVSDVSVPITFPSGSGRAAVDGAGQVLGVSAIGNSGNSYSVGDVVTFTENGEAGEGTFRVATIN